MRRFPERPIVGVGAVVLNGDGRVLLVKRAHEPLKGEWSLPGGGVEVGETLEAAVVARAVRRDRPHRSASARSSRCSIASSASPDGRVEYHFVIIDYLCHATDDRLVRGSDADDARWVAGR